MQLILNQGIITQYDDEFKDLINRWVWFNLKSKTDGRIYAHRHPENNNDNLPLLMHRLILNHCGLNITGYDVDHKDRNGLNNLKKNLRICTRSQNMENRGKQCNNVSGYKGVSWDKSRQKWSAEITINYQKIHLGRYRDIKDAARAYNKAAKMYFKEFAYLNEID